MKKSLFLLILVFIGCSSSSEQERLKVFVLDWSKALESTEGAARMFYENQTAFPKVIFTDTEGVQFYLNTKGISIARSEQSEDWQVDVPYQISDPNGENAVTGSILLTIKTTERGFLIRDMTPELAMAIKQRINHFARSRSYTEKRIMYDSIQKAIQAQAIILSEHYDTVAFYTDLGDKLFFYVVKGRWNSPYLGKQSEQRDSGNYKLGVVTTDNRVIIPVEYSKIYNPNGSFPGMIEVENNGLRGLFTIGGEVFIPAEFNGIYPVDVPGVFAQVKKGESYGWVDKNGKVSFEPTSNQNKSLFLSPIESNAILGWQFKYPGNIKPLVNPYDVGYITGVLVYPSFLRDIGVTSIANTSILLEISEDDMGMTDAEIKFEKTEKISDKLFGLVSFFMESGADARGYHSSNHDLFAIDNNLNQKGHQEKITEYGFEFEYSPCDSMPPSYKTIAPGLYEAKAGANYSYYKISEDGNIGQLHTVRKYDFTKFTVIDESYLNNCDYESLVSEGSKNNDDGLPAPNVVVIDGISSEELDVMRNEIFAEYGLIFKTSKWSEYFASKEWYRPQFETVDQFLTDKDKQNIRFILEYQRKHKEQKVKRDSIFFYWP